MRVYTVHEPPLRRREIATAPERFVFVRDGFHFWAFVLGPVWMLWHRLWLVLLIYLVLTAALQAVLFALGVSALVKFVVGFLVALLVGFEAASLRRFSYRRWRNLGPVVARDLEAAEHRFFEAWARRDADTAAPAPIAPGPDLRTPPPASDVIGLFPEPLPRP